MSDAFKKDAMPLPECKARRPHLRDHDENGCKMPNGQAMRMEPMLQGASNSWFAIALSALAIPQASGKLRQLIDDHWTILEKVESEQNIALLQQVTPQLRDLAEYTPAEIWQASRAKKAAAPEESDEPADLKTPEWEVFIEPDSAEKSRDFQLRVAAPPKRYFEKIVWPSGCVRCGHWSVSPALNRRAIMTTRRRFQRISGHGCLALIQPGFRPRRFEAKGCSSISRKT